MTYWYFTYFCVRTKLVYCIPLPLNIDTPDYIWDLREEVIEERVERLRRELKGKR